LLALLGALASGCTRPDAMRPRVAQHRVERVETTTRCVGEVCFTYLDDQGAASDQRR